MHHPRAGRLNPLIKLGVRCRRLGGGERSERRQRKDQRQNEDRQLDLTVERQDRPATETESNRRDKEANDIIGALDPDLTVRGVTPAGTFPVRQRATPEARPNRDASVTFTNLPQPIHN